MRGGNDTAYGKGGSDSIHLSQGLDAGHGESGFDQVWGGVDNDTLWGGYGHDRIIDTTDFQCCDTDDGYGGPGHDYTDILDGDCLDAWYAGEGEDLEPDYDKKLYTGLCNGTGDHIDMGS